MKRIYCISLIVMSALTASAQIGIKTNLAYDATATVNIGAEVAVAPRWSVDVSGNINFWSFSDGKRWKHWLLQPEGRYWFCDAMGGHFLAFHALGGQYNIGKVDLNLNFLGTDFRKLKDSRYQGWYAGAGVGYGYAWRLHRHWNVEAEIAIGWIYTQFDKYPCAVCGTKLASNRPHNYFGPTKAALNLVYIF